MIRGLVTLLLIWSVFIWGPSVQAAPPEPDVAFEDLPSGDFVRLRWAGEGPRYFTFTFAAGQYNSLPAGADRVQVTVAGAESVTKELLRSSLPDPNANAQLTFYLTPGQYTYTAQALQGSLLAGSVLSTIGPIPVTAAANFPLSIPLITAFATFDNYQTDIGLDTPNTFIYFGTPDRDRIVQYGGAVNDLLSVDIGAGDDWSEQYGGGGDDIMVADSWNRKRLHLPGGGAGNNNLTVTGR